MKKLMKVFSCMLMVVIMTAMMITPAFAADASVTYVGGEDNFKFAPGSGYTGSDLFPNFKNLWPGDSIEQKITFKNDSDESHYINLYLKAVPHDADNPLSYSETYENADKRDQANIDGQRDETIDGMAKFLQALKITVTHGDTVVYENNADMAANMTDSIFLGKFHKGEGTELTVKIEAPITLGNEFAGRVGEIDWQFTAEQRNYPPKTLTVYKEWAGTSDNMPSTVTVILLQDGTEVDRVKLGTSNNWKYKWTDLYGNSEWTVQEVVPNGFINSIWTTQNGDDITVVITNTAALIQTGQLNWPVPVMAVLGLLLMIAGFVLVKKGRAHE